MPMDKIAKIPSQRAKYNVFYGTEASSIINSYTLYTITKNCDRYTHCSSLIIVHYWVILTKSAFFGNHYILQYWNHSPVFFRRYFENDLLELFRP